MSNASTSSLGFTAYLQLKGYKLSKTPEVIEKSSPVTQNKIEKYNFTFDISQQEMNEHYNTYVTTEFYNFDSILHQLRKSVSKINTRRNCVNTGSK